MIMHARLILASVILAPILALVGGTARADDLTPALDTAAYRATADEAFAKLLTVLPTRERAKLIGAYVAHDDDAADPVAQAACDDDGDGVVVVSDAMLRLLADVARATSFDEISGSRRVEEYAEYLARVQIPGRRLLPPPAGFYVAQTAGSSESERFREAVAFVVARETAHLVAGDLRCPHPTATREHGDHVWTEAERRKARETADVLYPGRAAERDGEATTWLVNGGRGEAGALGLLRFFATVEVQRTTNATRFEPTYLRTHPSANTRIMTVRGSAALARAKTSGR